MQGTNKNGEGSRREEAGKLAELGISLTEEKKLFWNDIWTSGSQSLQHWALGTTKLQTLWKTSQLKIHSILMFSSSDRRKIHTET